MAIPNELTHFEGEDCIITFEREESGLIYNVEGEVLSWNIGGGTQPTEDIFAFGNKTFNFQKPREKFTLSFEVMVTNTDFSFVQMGAYGQATGGAGDELQTDNKLVMSDQSNSRWRVMFWFQDSASHVANSSRSIIVPAKTAPIYRMIFVDVKSVSFDKEFSADEYLKGTLNLEFSATDENGQPNYIEQEGLATGTASTQLASLTTVTADAASNPGLLVKARGYLDWSATTTPGWTAGTTTTRYRYVG